MRPILLAAAAVLTTSGSLVAQKNTTVTIGTDPEAPWEWQGLGTDHTGANLRQSFVAPEGVTWLRDVTFWFAGYDGMGDHYQTQFSIYREPYWDPETGNEIRERIQLPTVLDQSASGIYRLFVGGPHGARIEPGALYFMNFYGVPEWNSFLEEFGEGATPDPRHGALVQTTPGDAYEDGSLGGDYGLAHRDLRFSASFVVAPEPSTWILLGTGLLALGAVSLRRRKFSD